MTAQGWLTDMPRLFESAGLSLDEDVVFAVAEENSEYDANTDAALQNELC